MFDIFDKVLGGARSQIELVMGDSNLFPRVNVLAARGDVTDGHGHNFDHVTFCCKGRLGVEAMVAGQTVRTVVPVGSLVLIRSEVEHRLVGLEDDTHYICLYAHRDPQGAVQARYTGWPDAYV